MASQPPCYQRGVIPRILVVDDEPEAVELVEFNLKQAGFDVTSASDGVEALKKARGALPELIVLDVMLPEVDGMEICKTLRRDRNTAGIPIIMLTAKADDNELLSFGELVIDNPRHLVSWKGKGIELTATEFKLLTVLAQRRGRVQSREQLLRDVWEYNNLIDTRTVDTHMRRLREKLGPASKYLDTVRGVGYRFVEG